MHLRLCSRFQLSLTNYMTLFPDSTSRMSATLHQMQPTARHRIASILARIALDAVPVNCKLVVDTTLNSGWGQGLQFRIWDVLCLVALVLE